MRNTILWVHKMSKVIEFSLFSLTNTGDGWLDQLVGSQNQQKPYSDFKLCASLKEIQWKSPNQTHEEFFLFLQGPTFLSEAIFPKHATKIEDVDPSFRLHEAITKVRMSLHLTSEEMFFYVVCVWYCLLGEVRKGECQEKSRECS